MKIEESISKLKRFKYHAIGRLELEDAIDNVVSWYEQMMKEAVESTVENGIFLSSMDCSRMGYNLGDKVRVVICKKEDEK